MGMCHCHGCWLYRSMDCKDRPSELVAFVSASFAFSSFDNQDALVSSYWLLADRIDD